MHEAAVRASPQPVRLKRKRLEAYRRLVGDDAVASIRDLASDLRGVRVLELSSTATGGGVAEILSSLIPLEFLITRLLRDQLALLGDVLG